MGRLDTRRRVAHGGAWVLVLSAALGLGCSSARTYRADPLADFLAKKQYRLEDADFMLTVGRLGKSEIVRVLGKKSGPLASSAVVVQMRLTALSGRIGVNRREIRLVADEDYYPLSSEEVLAAVSAPANFGTAALPVTSQPGAGPRTGTGLTGGLTAITELGFAGLAAAARAMALSGNKGYWESARADVEEKTLLPREVAPGETLNLLLVFLPKSGKPPVECSLSFTPLLDGEERAASTITVPLF
ncbi:MAG TPA: hypothetical protein VGH97_16825 [Thermoanaerobaculia bacterium]|jgi:hypothetical protein